jgi:hypothetical protein
MSNKKNDICIDYNINDVNDIITNNITNSDPLSSIIDNIYSGINSLF